MKASYKFGGAAIAGAVLLILTSASAARGEQKHVVRDAPRGSVLSMAKFYSGAIARIGDFPGTLVCLRCDLKGGPAAMSQCEKEGHRHALAMEDDNMIHPLLPGTEKVLKQINSGELHGKQLTVHGKYYAATGAILVDRIAEAK